MDLPTLRRQLHIGAPVARFAVRLSLALFFGCLLGEALPNSAHGVWIMLTVAIVMSLVADLDSPRTGVIHIGQQSLERLQLEFNSRVP